MREIKNVQEHNEIVSGSKPVLLDFYADWCGPCRTLLPIVDELSDKYADDYEIVKINVDKNQELASHYGVRSIPALFFVEDKVVTENLVGLQTKASLEAKIEKRLVKA